MANVRSSNTWYVDTAGESLTAKNVALVGIIITATSGGQGNLTLGDDVAAASYPTKFDWIQASNTSLHRNFDSPIIFPNGIRVINAANVHATLIIRIPGESS